MSTYINISIYVMIASLIRRIIRVISIFF